MWFIKGVRHASPPYFLVYDESCFQELLIEMPIGFVVALASSMSQRLLLNLREDSNATESTGAGTGGLWTTTGTESTAVGSNPASVHLKEFIGNEWVDVDVSEGSREASSWW